MSLPEQAAVLSPEPADRAAEDPIAGLPVSSRPALAIGAIAVLWAAAVSTPAAVNMSANANEAVVGMVAWLGLTLVGAFPAGALAGALSARIERAATGIRHPQRALWVPFGIGTMLAAHWALHLVWAPLLLVSGASGGYRSEDHLLGAVAAVFAWAFAGAGVGLASFAWQRLQRREWAGVSAVPPRLGRLETPWLAAALYGVFVLAPALLVVGIGIDDEPAASVGGWIVAGVALSAPPAFLGVWWYGRVRHATGPHRAAARFWEIVGALWTVHWGLPLLIALLPFWPDSRHDNQLALAVGVAFLLTVSTALWGVARAHRHAAAG